MAEALPTINNNGSAVVSATQQNTLVLETVRDSLARQTDFLEQIFQSISATLAFEQDSERDRRLREIEAEAEARRAAKGDGQIGGSAQVTTPDAIDTGSGNFRAMLIGIGALAKYFDIDAWLRLPTIVPILTKTTTAAFKSLDLLKDTFVVFARGIDLILEPFRIASNSLVNAVKLVTPALSGISGKLTTFADSITTNIGNKLTTLTDSIKTNIGTKLTTFTDNIKTNIGTKLDTFTDSLKFGGKTFDEALGKWRDARGKFTTAPTKLGQMVDTFSTASTKISTTFTTFTEKLGTIGDDVAKLTTTVGTKFQAFMGIAEEGTGLRGLMAKVGDFLGPIRRLGFVVGQLIKRIAYPLTFIIAIYDGITGFMEEYADSGSVIKSIGAAFTNIIDGLITDLVQLAGDILVWIAGALGLDNLAATFTELTKSLTDGITAATQGIVDIVVGIFTLDMELLLKGIKGLVGLSLIHI